MNQEERGRREGILEINDTCLPRKKERTCVSDMRDRSGAKGGSRLAGSMAITSLKNLLMLKDQKLR